MVDKFPKSLYHEARTYETNLRHSKKVLFDPHAVVDGAMACLLSLVSQGRVSFFKCIMIIWFDNKISIFLAGYYGPKS
jgi:hypothetical protein